MRVASAFDYCVKLVLIMVPRFSVLTLWREVSSCVRDMCKQQILLHLRLRCHL